MGKKGSAARNVHLSSLLALVNGRGSLLVCLSLLLFVRLPFDPLSSFCLRKKAREKNRWKGQEKKRPAEQ